jgi:signal transduction histidine kinase
MTLRLRLAFLFAAVLAILSGLFLISAQGHLLRQLEKNRISGQSASHDLDEREIRALIRELTGLWFIAGVPVMGLSFLLGFLLASRSVHHLRQINDGLGAIRTEDLSRGIKVPDQDPELQNLVRNINDLLARVGKSYGELSEFSARVAHELRTPLALLRLRIEENAAKLPADFSEDLQEEIRRLSRLVERSLVASRAEGGMLELTSTPLDLSAILGDLHEDYAALAGVKDLTLGWQCPTGLTVQGDHDAVRQILHNLLDNAMRYSGSQVSLVASPADPTGRIHINITNDLKKITAAERGTGLGLRLSRALAAAMPGWIFRDTSDHDLHRATLSGPTA